MEAEEAVWQRRRRRAYVAFAVGLAIFVVWFGIPTDRLGLAALATGFLSIGLLGKGWHAWRRMMLDWVPFQLVLLTYDLSRGIASPYSDAQMAARDYPTHDVHNALGLPLQVRPPIDFDQWLAGLLGMGTTPTQWLQSQLHPGPVDGTAIPWFALLVSLVYCSHYLVMPVTAVVTWIRDRAEFRQWMTMVITLAVAGLATYVLLPTAPPWLASYEGDLDGPPVLRLTSEGFDQVRSRHGRLCAEARPGPGQPGRRDAVAARSLRHARRRLLVVTRTPAATGPCCRSIPLAMCFALAYAGEHYVLDELAGVAYALVILVTSSRVRGTSTLRGLGQVEQATRPRNEVARARRNPVSEQRT